MPTINIYLRASTNQQDATRAFEEAMSFVRSTNELEGAVVQAYTETASGTVINRPVLNNIINNAKAGDVLVVEKADRLTRLGYEMYQELKQRLREKGLVIVVVDQPMTHAGLKPAAEQSMLARTLTDFMLDIAAAMARDDYETRTKRSKQGIAKAKAIDAGLKAEGKQPVKYKGRQEDVMKQGHIRSLLAEGKSPTEISKAYGYSRQTVYKVKKLIDA